MTDKELQTIDATPAAMIQAAIEKGADPAALTEMYALYERHQANEARKAYNRAVAAFKADPPQIIKRKEVDYTSRRTGQRTHYMHAKLDDIVEQVTPALHKHGLSHRWDIRQGENGITVICVLSHEDGHSEAVPMSGPADDSGNKNAIQQAGSTVTYLQRYTLMAILGLAASDDDDAGGPAPASAERITDEQALELEARAADYELTEKMLDWIAAKTGERAFASIPATGYARALVALNKAIKAHQGDG